MKSNEGSSQTEIKVPQSIKQQCEQQAILPMAIKESVTNRLKQNIKIVEIVNINRFERSKSRKKLELRDQEKKREGTSKKKVINEIRNKLDCVLKQSKNSLDDSRKCYSQTKDIAKRIKVFETTLKQAKQNNIQVHHQLNKIKNQIGDSTSILQTQQEQYQKKQKLTKYVYKKPSQNFINHYSKYSAKKQYVYPKYLKPQTSKRRVANICIEPECRTYCKCSK